MIKKGILVGIIFLIQLLMSDSLFAKSIPIRVQSDTLYAGDTLEVFSIERVVDEVRAGDVVVLSEYHDNLTHHLHQKEFLEALTERHPEIKISVGMEFFEYTDQNDVDRFLKGEVEEKVFLEEIKWGSISFDFYRPLVLQPLESKGWTYGINAPRALTSKVSKQGLESLNDQERSLLPPQFELGLDSYKKRFVEVIGGGHPLPERQIERYFT
ncbi:MAG: ChaN family lipoprotein, partial [Bdellovibrionales bacterium]|nr:ChaN family lipoprotein [Bdellovibrionales bacterium]